MSTQVCWSTSLSKKKGWKTPDSKLSKLEKWMKKNRIDRTVYKFTHIKNLTGKLDSFWKVRHRALESLNLCFPYCSGRDQLQIQNHIIHRLKAEKVHPVVRNLEIFKRNNDQH